MPQSAGAAKDAVKLVLIRDRGFDPSRFEASLPDANAMARRLLPLVRRRMESRRDVTKWDAGVQMPGERL